MAREGAGVALRERVEHTAERLPLDESRAVKKLALLIQPKLIDGQNAGMLELAGDLRFADETEHVLDVRLALGTDDFDRDIAEERRVVSLEDRARPALHRHLAKVVALGAKETVGQMLKYRRRKSAPLELERAAAELHAAFERMSTSTLITT